MIDHYELRHKTGMYLMSCIAEGLGKPSDFFDRWYEKDTLSTFAANHYAPRSRATVN